MTLEGNNKKSNILDFNLTDGFPKKQEGNEVGESNQNRLKVTNQSVGDVESLGDIFKSIGLSCKKQVLNSCNISELDNFKIEDVTSGMLFNLEKALKKNLDLNTDLFSVLNNLSLGFDHVPGLKQEGVFLSKAIQLCNEHKKGYFLLPELKECVVAACFHELEKDDNNLDGLISFYVDSVYEEICFEINQLKDTFKKYYLENSADNYQNLSEKLQEIALSSMLGENLPMALAYKNRLHEIDSIEYKRHAKNLLEHNKERFERCFDEMHINGKEDLKILVYENLTDNNQLIDKSIIQKKLEGFYVKDLFISSNIAPLSCILQPIKNISENIINKIEELRQGTDKFYPIGAKIHFNKPLSEENKQLLFSKLGFESTSFKMIHADSSMLLPPRKSSKTLMHIIQSLFDIGVLDEHMELDLQPCIPGRLNNQYAGILGSAMIFSSYTCVNYGKDSFSTSHNGATGARIMAYDDGQLDRSVKALPKHLKGRTDMLGRRDVRDLYLYQVIGSLVSQSVYGGQLQTIGKNFIEEYVNLLHENNLLNILNGKWIYDRKYDTESNADEHYQLVKICTDQWLKDFKEGSKTGFIYQVRSLLTKYIKIINYEQKEEIITVDNLVNIKKNV